MKKVTLLAVIAAATLSLSAQAKTAHYKQHAASNQSKQCFILTDNRGFGHWESCGTHTEAASENESRIGDHQWRR